MFKDPYFVITFQLTLIGIVLIGGLFLIWKAISRIEENVDMLLIQKDKKCFVQTKEQEAQTLPEFHHGECDPIKMMESDSIMQQLFSTEEKTHIDLDLNVGVDTKVEELAPSEHGVSTSEISESPISRNKLRQMSLDKIKSMCEEKGLSIDGTKNQLIDKLLLA